MLARRNVWKRDRSHHAHVELTEAELNLVAASALVPISDQDAHDLTLDIDECDDVPCFPPKARAA
jgi:hypothetical protein